MVSTWDIFGTVSIGVVFIQVIRCVVPWLYENFLGPAIGSGVNLKEMGDWALITGATEGIGKAYSQLLAKRGLNVILVSRSMDKLKAVAEEIENKYKVRTKSIQIDFSGGEEIYEVIEKQTAGMEIGVLVNNVGVSYSNPEYFLNIVKQDIVKSIISCNIMSVVHMCRIILPGMIDRQKGVIINVSSMAAQIPNPLLTVYAASKAFVDKFSDDLQTEYRDNGIIVQSVLPGFVATNMSKIKRPTLMSPSPTTYVSSALKTVGISGHTTGYKPHTMLLLLLNTFETLLPETTKTIVMSQLKNIRARALKRSTN